MLSHTTSNIPVANDIQVLSAGPRSGGEKIIPIAGVELATSRNQEAHKMKLLPLSQVALSYVP